MHICCSGVYMCVPTPLDIGRSTARHTDTHTHTCREKHLLFSDGVGAEKELFVCVCVCSCVLVCDGREDETWAGDARREGFSALPSKKEHSAITETTAHVRRSMNTL